jgi:transposase-like protein
MTYKQQIQNHELITKVRIIRAVRRDHVPIGEVAKAFGCHRNTVGSIMRQFNIQISKPEQDALMASHASFTSNQLQETYGALVNKSRKPLTNKRSVRVEVEQEVVAMFTEKKICVGVKRMKTYIARSYDQTDSALLQITSGQMRGIYKRNGLRCTHVRSGNGERRHLYDYEAIGCFERMHYDVKHVLDKHALPAEVYDTLSGKEVPRYEWNLIDVRSRFRFIGYSYELNAEFGFRFLLFCIQYLRSVLPGYTPQIEIGVDNGTEFCAGSQRKEQEWNEVLAQVQAHLYSYEPRFDIRKNLIERSHLTDDEELYIPRGSRMGTRDQFHTEVTLYSRYWNFIRAHSGQGMHNRTPYEVLCASGLIGVQKLPTFPVLILDEVIDGLRTCNRIIELDHYLHTNPTLVQKSLTDQNLKRKIEDRFYLSSNAQNVLTYYQR